MNKEYDEKLILEHPVKELTDFDKSLFEVEPKIEMSERHFCSEAALRQSRMWKCSVFVKRQIG